MSTSLESLDPTTTALILIDLQNLIVDLPLAPIEGRPLVDRAAALAARFRNAGATVLMVRADMAGDPSASLRQSVDEPISHPREPLRKDWADFAEGLADAGDVIISKRQWGAFYGTDLDLQLRRRAIKTVVIGGIATNFGVESTARQAWEHGYTIILSDDLMTSFSREMHEFAVQHIFPKIGRVRQSRNLMFELSKHAE